MSKIKPNIVRGGRAIDLGNNLFYMSGKKHSQGGIDIGQNAKTGLEVEGGEVVQITPQSLKVFSAQPILNGISPAQYILGGANPNQVFNAQEYWKQVNRVNDDGTQARLGTKRDKKNFKTILSKRQEKEFQNWYKNVSSQLKLDENPDNPAHNYDYRGYWLENRNKDIDFSIPDFHFPDKYKTPAHETFSRESIYADKEYGIDPKTVGYWDGETFKPGDFNSILQASLAYKSPLQEKYQQKTGQYFYNNEPYTPSQAIIDYIKDVEKFSPTWYKDGNGIDTIGYGFTGSEIKKQFPNGITKEEADRVFADSLAVRAKILQKDTPNWDSLNQNQRDALLSYHYNIGEGNYRNNSPNMQQGLRDKNWEKVSENIDFGYNDKKNSGLRKRRDYERNLFNTPVEYKYGGRVKKVIGGDEDNPNFVGPPQPKYYDTIEPAVITAKLPAKFNGSQAVARRYAEGYQFGKKVNQGREDWLRNEGTAIAGLSFGIPALGIGLTTAPLPTIGGIVGGKIGEKQGRKINEKYGPLVGGLIGGALGGITGEGLKVGYDVGKNYLNGVLDRTAEAILRMGDSARDSGTLGRNVLKSLKNDKLNIGSRIKQSAKLISKYKELGNISKQFLNKNTLNYIFNPKANPDLAYQMPFKYSGESSAFDSNYELLGSSAHKGDVIDQFLGKVQPRKYKYVNVDELPESIDGITDFNYKKYFKQFYPNLKRVRVVNLGTAKKQYSSSIPIKLSDINTGETVHYVGNSPEIRAYFSGKPLLDPGHYHSYVTNLGNNNFFASNYDIYKYNSNQFANTWKGFKTDIFGKIKLKGLKFIDSRGEPIIYKWQNDIIPSIYKYGGIHIKPSKRGTFTAEAKRRGLSVQELAAKILANKHRYSSAMIKKAVFARNARKWKHKEFGGEMTNNYYITPNNIYKLGGRKKAIDGTQIIIPYGTERIPIDSTYSYLRNIYTLPLVTGQLDTAYVTGNKKVLPNIRGNVISNSRLNYVPNQSNPNFIGPVLKPNFDYSELNSGLDTAYVYANRKNLPSIIGKAISKDNLEYTPNQNNPNFIGPVYRPNFDNNNVEEGQTVSQPVTKPSTVSSPLDSPLMDRNLLISLARLRDTNTSPKSSIPQLNSSKIAADVASQTESQAQRDLNSIIRNGNNYINLSTLGQLNLPTRLTTPSSTLVDIRTPKSLTNAQRLGLRISNGLRTGLNAVGNFIRENPLDVAETAINLGGNLAASLINRRAIKDLESPSAPLPLRANKLKTRININPQLDEIRETVASYEDDVTRNTASSKTALANRQNIRARGMQYANQLRGQKENIETSLINEDRMNQQNVGNQNVQLVNNWLNNITEFKNNKRLMQAENSVAGINNAAEALSGLISGVRTNKQINMQRDRDILSAAIMAVANPNAQKVLGDASIINSIMDNIRKQFYAKK